VSAPFGTLTSGTDAPLSLWSFSIRRGSRKGFQQNWLRGPAAAAEFKKFLDHPAGIVQNVLLGSLAHFQLARAYALQSDTAKARTAYKDFLALWQDADPDIPILKEAKAEFEKLQ
jgi:hypothetical protein